MNKDLIAMLRPGQKFTTTAILESNGEYNHFGANPMTVGLMGHKPEEIVTITLEIAKDQTVPPPPQKSTNHRADYWGFYSYRSNVFSMIYKARFLLDICFPHGIAGSEEAKEGKAFRLNVVK